jgi:hypothetical protein
MRRSIVTIVVAMGLMVFAAMPAQAQGGYEMGPGMMGGYGQGYSMGPGMMGGYGPGHHFGQGVPSEACNKFLSETAPLRKELHNKRFEYWEAMRDPSTSPETVGKLVKEIHSLQAKIQAKNSQGCWWNN